MKMPGRSAAGIRSEFAPYPVERPVMYQNWERLTFLHWAQRAADVQSRLPRGLEIDTFDGMAWVGLTPFEVTGLRFPGFPVFPGISRFPEMNLRTYVRGPDGEPGIWFFTLEADRMAAVLGARISYRLPYHWARMRIEDTNGVLAYNSRGVFDSSEARIEIRRGQPIRPNELEIFLTARFRLYTLFSHRIAYAQVQHEPWPLHSAEAVTVKQNLVERYGFDGAVKPLIHFSPGVQTRIGRPAFAKA